MCWCFWIVFCWLHELSQSVLIKGFFNHNFTRKNSTNNNFIRFLSHNLQKVFLKSMKILKLCRDFCFETTNFFPLWCWLSGVSKLKICCDVITFFKVFKAFFCFCLMKNLGFFKFKSKSSSFNLIQLLSKIFLPSCSFVIISIITLFSVFFLLPFFDIRQP